ncbi:FAD-dependent oxidoreductase [Spirosoma luteolum]
MIREQATDNRLLRTVRHEADLLVIGGGLAGVCCALTAARAGIQVLLVQDRPVLGGNASSEVRLWVLGATSHMGNNNRWAREGGVIDELLLENLYRNPEGNPLIFDTILLEKVVAEANITLLLNTAVYNLTMSPEEAGRIEQVQAFCAQNSTQYELVAPLYCDASGDGIVAFLAGAAFRMGAESTDEFGERFAPSADYGELLGHSLYFYSKDTGKPVRFVPPAYALDDITSIPRFRSFNTGDYGCRLWWLEYGGRHDTVHDTETIKWELWRVVYGAWNYIKNSGNFPEAANLTLEWVGHIPGKRESRRFEGDYILTQQDIIEQRTHTDAVAFGGWSIDLHPADGVFSEKPGCNQWHSKGLYTLPYRCFYSRNVSNLFLAGRIISASHVAFGSSRVMGTSAHGGQAVGMAAALCTRQGIRPRDLTTEPALMQRLQQALLATGHHIPGQRLYDENDLTQRATLSVSSELILTELLPDGPMLLLQHSIGQMLPLHAGAIPALTVWASATEDTLLTVELRISRNAQNHTPDHTLERRDIPLTTGSQALHLVFTEVMPHDGYAFVCFLKNERVSMQGSQQRVTGILSVFNKTNPAVSNYGKQEPTTDIGVEAFEFWTPDRRPKGHNLAMQIRPGLRPFSAENVRNGLQRPTTTPNAWVAEPADAHPTLTLSWPEARRIREVVLNFDTDFDHPLESVLMTHPETRSPFCVADIVLCDDRQQQVYEATNNYLSQRVIQFEPPLSTRSLSIHLANPGPHVPAALLAVRCYA